MFYNNIIGKVKKDNFCLILYCFFSSLMLLKHSNDYIILSSFIILSIFIYVLLNKYIGILGEKVLFVLFIITISLLYTSINFKCLGSVMHTLNLLLGCLFFNNLIISNKFYKYVHLLFFVLITYFLSTFDTPQMNVPLMRSIYGKGININGYAILTIASYLHFCCFFDSTNIKNNRIKLIINLIMAFIVYKYITLTQCRSALISLYVFWVLLIINSFTKKLKYYLIKFNYLIIRFILLLIVAFPFIYLWWWNNPDIKMFKDGGIKSFFSRYIVWANTIYYISLYPLCGSGNTFAVEGQQVSCHNYLLGMWKMFGLISVLSIVYIIAYRKKTRRIFIVYNTPQLAFISSLFIGFFESFLSDSYFMLMFMPFLIYKIEPQTFKGLEYDS